MKTKVTYELVTDLSSNEIAKAMIDGEVFYSESGNVTLGWDSGSFLTSNNVVFCVKGPFYRRVEKQVKWWDNLDGTVDNGVLCFVSDEYEPNQEDIYCDTTLIVDFKPDKSLPLREVGGSAWKYATPVSKDMLQKWLDNAPE